MKTGGVRYLELLSIDYEMGDFGSRYKLTFRCLPCQFATSKYDNQKIVAFLHFKAGLMPRKMKMWFSIMSGREINDPSDINIRELVGKIYQAEILVDDDENLKGVFHIFYRRDLFNSILTMKNMKYLTKGFSLN